MIIVEGPDCSGKTTFCGKLLQRLPSHVYCHFTRLPAEFDYYWGYVERASARVVQDRFHLSEIIYSQVRGLKPQICPETYRLVDARLRQLGCLTVLLTSDLALIRGRWDTSQMYDTEKTLEAANLYDVVRLEGSLHDHASIDVDVKIHCTPGRPYATDDDVERVLAAYQQRQGRLRTILERRPAGL